MSECCAAWGPLFPPASPPQPPARPLYRPRFPLSTAAWGSGAQRQPVCPGRLERDRSPLQRGLRVLQALGLTSTVRMTDPGSRNRFFIKNQSLKI